jgi:hypothetical protein
VRTRHSLAAALIALVAILVGVVITVLMGRGPHAHADVPIPAPTPSTAEPPPSGTAAGHGTKSTGPSRTSKPSSSRKSTPPPSGKTGKTGKTGKSSAAVTRSPKAAGPARIGRASVPDGATYSVAGDGRTFTMVFSTLESGTELGRLARSQSTTVPVGGDTGSARLVLGVSGYAFADAATSVKLTIGTCAGTSVKTYRAGTDREFVRTVDVPLGGAGECRITIKVEVSVTAQVRGTAGYLNVLALDGRLE